MPHNGRYQTSDSAICSDWIEFISLATTCFDGEIRHLLDWTVESNKLPPMYDRLPIKTNHCRFSNKSRYYKMFCGHKFKIGGHKE